MNKIDMLEISNRVLIGTKNKPIRVWLSAQTGAGYHSFFRL
ncbi:hypothetical protein ACVXG9_02830 [Escherichia coli]